MSFQSIVLKIAIVVFILNMMVIAVLMTSAKKATIFPPEVGTCPDYWTLMEDGKCMNTKNLGDMSGECNSGLGIDFKNNYPSKLEKCNFAKDCNIEWDGIRNVGLC
jgi:hypothetical protein